MREIGFGSYILTGERNVADELLLQVFLHPLVDRRNGSAVVHANCAIMLVIRNERPMPPRPGRAIFSIWTPSVKN